MDETDPAAALRALRGQLSSMSGVFALSMVMFGTTDEQEILRLAVSAVPTLGPFRVEGTYLVRKGLTRVGDGSALLRDRLAALGGADGAVTVADASWSWAYPLRALGGHAGYLVVSGGAPPSADQTFLLTRLAQQTGAALRSAALYLGERHNTAELATVNAQLRSAVADLEQRTRIHQLLTEVAARGMGEAGIAAALHELTGLPVAIEDRFGNLRAWGGPGRPARYRRPPAWERSQLVADAQRSGHPVRHWDRLVALAQPRDEVLGVVALIDPERRAGQHELFALEHGAVVLAMELAHQRGLAEIELRLRRDLVDDLLAGTDDESALSRATALGHDLSRPHRVLVVLWTGDREEKLARAVGQAAARVLEGDTLLARRGGEVVLVVPGSAGGDAEGERDRRRWGELHETVGTVMRSRRGAIGVGRPSPAPSLLPTSYSEALRALNIRHASNPPWGVTSFDDLGIVQVLAGSNAQDEIAEYVQEWLGTLIEYDARNRSELVRTLWQYYECGGNYDATARTLLIHRSTLRYRLRRIRELSGHDLGDVESRLNLHLATRVWQLIGQ